MTISEVSKRYNLTQDTLRYYERIGLIPPIGRNQHGIRNYNEHDCGWIEFIKCMRNAGLPIEALIEYVALFHQGDSTHQTRKAILSEQREMLAARIEILKQTLNRLDKKIADYDKHVIVSEKKLK